MSRSKLIRWGPLLAGVAWAGAAFAETTSIDRTVAAGDNPYAAIVARNAFRLKDPVPPPPPPTNAPPPPEQPKVDVKLAGLASIKGVRYAYLMVPDTKRPGQFLYPTLTDQDSKGPVVHGESGVEVKEINLKERKVRIVNGGIEATLTFADNGLKAAPVPSGPAKPGAIPAPGTAPRPMVRTVNTAATPGAATPATATAAAAEPLVFSRNPNRATGGNNNANPVGIASATANAVNAISANIASPDVVIPARPIRTSSVTPQPVSQPAAQPTPQLSVEQQYQILLQQRQAADQQGIQLPPIPGYPLPSDPNPH